MRYEMFFFVFDTAYVFSQFCLKFRLFILIVFGLYVKNGGVYRTQISNTAMRANWHKIQKNKSYFSNCPLFLPISPSFCHIYNTNLLYLTPPPEYFPAQGNPQSAISKMFFSRYILQFLCVLYITANLYCKSCNLLNTDVCIYRIDLR